MGEQLFIVAGRTGGRAVRGCRYPLPGHALLLFLSLGSTSQTVGHSTSSWQHSPHKVRNEMMNILTHISKRELFEPEELCTAMQGQVFKRHTHAVTHHYNPREARSL